MEMPVSQILCSLTELIVRLQWFKKQQCSQQQYSIKFEFTCLDPCLAQLADNMVHTETGLAGCALDMFSTKWHWTWKSVSGLHSVFCKKLWEQVHQPLDRETKLYTGQRLHSRYCSNHVTNCDSYCMHWTDRWADIGRMVYTYLP